VLTFRRGDFAAGKLLPEGGLERGEILPEDITQCVVDIDNKIASMSDGPELTSPAAPENLTAVAAKLPPLLDCVLALHDGGYHIFDYVLYSSEQHLQEDLGTAIGNNPLEPSTALAWDPASGAIVSIDTESGGQNVLAPSFGAYIEHFRDVLLRGKLEWADGWVAMD